MKYSHLDGSMLLCAVMPFIHLHGRWPTHGSMVSIFDGNCLLVCHASTAHVFSVGLRKCITIFFAVSLLPIELNGKNKNCSTFAYENITVSDKNNITASKRE